MCQEGNSKPVFKNQGAFSTHSAQNRSKPCTSSCCNLQVLNLLTFLGVEARRTEQHAGAHLGVVVEVPLAGRALARAPPNAAFTAFVAPPAPPGAVVTKEPGGAGAHAHPGEGTGIWCQQRAPLPFRHPPLSPSCSVWGVPQPWQPLLLSFVIYSVLEVTALIQSQGFSCPSCK